MYGLVKRWNDTPRNVVACPPTPRGGSTTSAGRAAAQSSNARKLSSNIGTTSPIGVGSTPIVEQPHRALSLLYALARGHALVHGRSQLSKHDLPLVARAALESTPNDRRAVVRILLRNGGLATTGDVQEALRCSAPTARAILETLDKLGVGSFENPGPPAPAALMIADSLRWIADCEATQPLKERRRRGQKRPGYRDPDDPAIRRRA